MGSFIDGTPAEKIYVLDPPTLLDIKNVSEISWQGSTGAQSYVIERKEEYEPKWEIISADADDSKYQYRSLFCDESAGFGKRYFYRMKAKNESGESDYSNIVGPVKVTTKKMIDEMENFDKVFLKSGELQLFTFHDLRKTKEDRSRLTGSDGSYIVYKLPANVYAVKVDLFIAEEGNEIEISAGEDIESFARLNITEQRYSFAKNDYGFFDAVSYSSENILPNARFVKINLNGGVQISRVEISYK